MNSIEGWTNGRVCAALLATGLVLSPLPGCKSKMEEISQYPFFIKTLDKRWEIARKSLASDQPNVGFALIIQWDLGLAVRAMEESYDGPNRDAAAARLRKITEKYEAETNAQVVKAGDQTVLRPGATVKDVADAVERAYQEYLQFRAMVKVK